jgi:hypothetical protein
MPKKCYLLCIAIGLWPISASAQPLFRYENNWIATIGEHSYGLRGVVQTPGDFRWTQIWFGRYTFDIRCRATRVIALLLLPPADCVPRFLYLVNWSSFRHFP